MIQCVTCNACPVRDRCQEICSNVSGLLPSMEQGRVDAEDLPRLWIGRITTHLILDYEDLLTDRQKQVVGLYYRESLLQKEIAAMLGISQPAVNQILSDVRRKVWKMYKKASTFRHESRPGKRPASTG